MARRLLKGDRDERLQGGGRAGMILTEKEAKEKNCPGDRFNSWEGTAHCVASGCMAWRWAEFHIQATKERRGYCGLAGKPLEK